jgi:hypothetical protein
MPVQNRVAKVHISRREDVLVKDPGPCQKGRVLANWRVVLLSEDTKSIAFADRTRHGPQRIAPLEMVFMAIPARGHGIAR